MMIEGEVLMDKNSLVNIDLQPIADVSNNLIDKLANGIGWLATPRGNKAQQIEAQNYLIEQIKNDENMLPLEKAASISNAKKILKEYANQNDIYNGAMNFLSEKENLELVDKVDDDWLEFFFDKAKGISRDEMKIIWSKLLAKEVVSPDSISKQLLHILTVIDHKEACSFAKLADYCIKADGKDVVVLYNEMLSEIYKDDRLVVEELFRLQDIGLVQYSVAGYTYSRETDEEVTYFGKEIETNIGEVFFVGSVLLSRAGEELMSILTERNEVEGLYELLNEKYKMK